MIRVACVTGGEAVYIAPGDSNQHVHERLNEVCSGHCADGHPQDHPHHEAAAACPKEHVGPCWSPGPGPDQVKDRPEGCLVCRPVHIELMPGSANVQAVN